VIQAEHNRAAEEPRGRDQRRWHDVPPGHPPVQESPPKRMIFSQPISELRPQTPAAGAAATPPKPAEAPKPQQLPPPQPQP
jgi:hypothetical protein